MESKMTVRVYLAGGLSRLIVKDSPALALEAIREIRERGIYDIEHDRHTGQPRVMNYYAPEGIVRFSIQAWDPTIPDQIEQVISGLGAVEGGK